VSVLSIAGSDSGGGAGIQADLRTFAAFEVHGLTALTAITAQNTMGVLGVSALEPDVVAAQIEAVTNDFGVAATKTGMLATARIVERVAEIAREGGLPRLVVDPVLVSTSGHALMDKDGVVAYQDALFPFAELITPNLDEAAVLGGVDRDDVKNLDDAAELGRALLKFGSSFVLVKGADPASTQAVDLLFGPAGLTIFADERVPTNNDHGTGCSLSAAIAAGLAKGRDIPEATRDAKSFVLAALRGASSWQLGHGRGPIDHLGWTK
jgi:hydroxymethylpyrimidine/phosphomethylpyrimidine kinase